MVLILEEYFDEEGNVYAFDRDGNRVYPDREAVQQVEQIPVNLPPNVIKFNKHKISQRRDNKAGVNDMKAIFASALMLISTAIMANAAEKDADISNYSASYWLPYCKDFVEGKQLDDNSYPEFCAGMIFGLGVLLRQDPKSPLYCVDIPEGVKFEQAIMVVIRYMEGHPQDMHQPFKYLALAAIMDAWPCEKK